MATKSLLNEASVDKWASDDYETLFAYYRRGMSASTKKAVIKTIRQSADATPDWYFPHAGMTAAVFACFATLS